MPAGLTAESSESPSTPTKIPAHHAPRFARGAAGKLLSDKTVAAQETSTIATASQAPANFNQTSRKVDTRVSTEQKSDLPEVNATLANTRSATTKVNDALGTMPAKGKSGESSSQSIHDTIQQAQQTTANLAHGTAAIEPLPQTGRKQ